MKTKDRQLSSPMTAFDSDCKGTYTKDHLPTSPLVIWQPPPRPKETQNNNLEFKDVTIASRKKKPNKSHLLFAQRFPQSFRITSLSC